MLKVAIVDIDNTLWDFASVLYDELIKINTSLPTPEDWHCWDFWKGYMHAHDFYQAIDRIHLRQDTFGVYPDAKDFLKELKSKGYKIIIASHRSKQSQLPTLNWLYKHNLFFDELHLSYDKTVLFNRCSVVIDDSPQILEKALKSNLIATGLEFAWNRNNGFRLFKSLSEIKDFINSSSKLTCQNTIKTKNYKNKTG